MICDVCFVGVCTDYEISCTYIYFLCTIQYFIAFLILFLFLIFSLFFSCVNYFYLHRLVSVSLCWYWNADNDDDVDVDLATAMMMKSFICSNWFVYLNWLKDIDTVVVHIICVHTYFYIYFLCIHFLYWIFIGFYFQQHSAVYFSKT